MKRVLKAVAWAIGLGTVLAAYGLAVASEPFFYGSAGMRSVRYDVEIYFSYASQTLAGKVPYRDFTVEYPPLAMPLFLLPRLVAADLRGYEIAFAAEMFLANALAIGLLAFHLDGRGAVSRRLGWYALVVASLCPLAACRFDLAVMAWTFAAALAWSSGRPFLGGILAGSGVLVKIVPGLVVLPALATARRPRIGRGLAGFVAALGLGLILWLAIGGRGVADSFRYHTGKGVEIGSLYAGGLMALARALGAPLSVATLRQGAEVQTPWSATVASIGFPAQAAAILLTVWRARRSGAGEPLRFMGATLLAFVAFGKVLSPQYLLWLIPLIACVEGRAGRWARGLFLVACLATTLLFPLGFVAALECRTWAVVVLNLRNALLLALWGLLAFGPRLVTGRS